MTKRQASAERDKRPSGRAWRPAGLFADSEGGLWLKEISVARSARSRREVEDVTGLLGVGFGWVDVSAGIGVISESTSAFALRDSGAITGKAGGR